MDAKLDWEVDVEGPGAVDMMDRGEGNQLRRPC